MIFLDRVDSVPLQGNESLSIELQRWFITIVDTMNTSLAAIEPLITDPQIITANALTAVVNSRYIPTNAGLTSITLPATCLPGDTIGIRGQGAGGWSLLVPYGQTIQFEGATAMTSIASSNRYDTIDVTCVVSNTTWVVNAYVSSMLIIT